MYKNKTFFYRIFSLVITCIWLPMLSVKLLKQFKLLILQVFLFVNQYFDKLATIWENANTNPILGGNERYMIVDKKIYKLNKMIFLPLFGNSGSDQLTKLDWSLPLKNVCRIRKTAVNITVVMLLSFAFPLVETDRLLNDVLFKSKTHDQVKYMLYFIHLKIVDYVAISHYGFESLSLP